MPNDVIHISKESQRCWINQLCSFSKDDYMLYHKTMEVVQRVAFAATMVKCVQEKKILFLILELERTI